jgi:gamma-glutamyltranspeptidase
MTVGAPGGLRVSTAVMQVILNVLDFGMNVQDAIDCPGLSWPLPVRGSDRSASA